MSSSALSLLWWVAIGLLFFWMMRRGGCGMRMSHGKGHEHEGHDRHASRPPSGKPIDPVCGMEVDPANAAGTRVVSGEIYFLCSQTCLEALDKDAEMYTHPRAAQPAHHHVGR